jgi:hypothetical protein
MDVALCTPYSFLQLECEYSSEASDNHQCEAKLFSHFRDTVILLTQVVTLYVNEYLVLQVTTLPKHTVGHVHLAIISVDPGESINQLV